MAAAVDDKKTAKFAGFLLVRPAGRIPLAAQKQTSHLSMNDNAKVISMDNLRQKSVLSGAYFAAKLMFGTGVMLGVAAVGIKILNIIPLSKSEAMNALFFIPCLVVLGSIGAAGVLKGLFFLVSQGKNLASIKVLIDAPPAQNLLGTIILSCYLFFMVAAALAAGFFMGCWMSLLFSGHVWMLISR